MFGSAINSFETLVRCVEVTNRKVKTAMEIIHLFEDGLLSSPPFGQSCVDCTGVLGLPHCHGDQVKSMGRCSNHGKSTPFGLWKTWKGLRKQLNLLMHSSEFIHHIPNLILSENSKFLVTRWGLLDS
jgi:hypothetical protein